MEVVNRDRFKKFIEETNQKFIPYSEQLTEKLLKLFDEVPNEFDQTKSTDSGSYTYDWLNDHIDEVVFNTIPDPEKNGEEIDDIIDAVYAITDVMYLIKGNPKSVLERAIALMD